MSKTPTVTEVLKATLDLCDLRKQVVALLPDLLAMLPCECGEPGKHDCTACKGRDLLRRIDAIERIMKGWRTNGRDK